MNAIFFSGFIFETGEIISKDTKIDIPLTL
jgi:hypothetical protein